MGCSCFPKPNRPARTLEADSCVVEEEGGRVVVSRSTQGSTEGTESAGLSEAPCSSSSHSHVDSSEPPQEMPGLGLGTGSTGMLVFVRRLDGQQMAVEVGVDTTVGGLLASYEALAQTAWGQLSLEGQVLPPEETLADCSVCAQCVVDYHPFRAPTVADVKAHLNTEGVFEGRDCQGLWFAVRHTAHLGRDEFVCDVFDDRFYNEVAVRGTATAKVWGPERPAYICNLRWAGQGAGGIRLGHMYDTKDGLTVRAIAETKQGEIRVGRRSRVIFGSKRHEYLVKPDTLLPCQP